MSKFKVGDFVTVRYNNSNRIAEIIKIEPYPNYDIKNGLCCTIRTLYSNDLVRSVKPNIRSLNEHWLTLLTPELIREKIRVLETLLPPRSGTE